MKNLSQIFLIFAGVVAVACTPTNAAVSNDAWIKIESVGRQDKPLPTIWISTQELQLPASGFNKRLVLDPATYLSVGNIVDAISCRNYGQDVQEFGTLLVTRVAKREVAKQCTISADRSCEFVSTISEVIVRNSRRESPEPLSNLSARLGCGNPPTD